MSQIVTVTHAHLLTFSSDQFMDDPSITQERYTRGYNPDYYGQDPPPLSRRSTYSAPDYGVDRGYLDEGEHRNRDEWRQRTGSMYDGWKSYKKISEQSIHDNLEYDRYLKATPMYRSGEQHAELARLARRASNSSLGAYSERMKHDLNYIGHYNDNKQRRGHLFYARDRRRAGMNAEKHLAFHNSFLD